MQPVNMHGAAKIKTFFSRSGRELPKLLIIFIYGGFATRSCPCFLLFVCSHPNAALMRIIRLFENIGGGGGNDCSHNLSQTLFYPELTHLQRCFPFIKTILSSSKGDLAWSLLLVYHWFKWKLLKVLDYFQFTLLTSIGMEEPFSKCFPENKE